MRYIRVAHDAVLERCRVTGIAAEVTWLMISDFIVEGYGYLCDDQGMARKSIETQRDGYFNDDMFIAQVADIFEWKFPGICGIFLFDNAPSHKKIST